MTEDQIYETWAPRNGRWSPWVKPVLFSFLNRVKAGEKLAPLSGLEGAPFSPATMAVIDLPGPDSVAAGLALAARGWRPTPLFNALPAPSIDIQVEESMGPLPGNVRITRSPAALDIFPLIAALRNAPPSLIDLQLPPAAPPAFLLDAGRGAAGWKPHHGSFDNRSISFPTDFPSTAKLRENGISRVLLIQQRTTPLDDLSPTLRQWQEEGLGIDLLIPGEGAQSRSCSIRKVTKLDLWWKKLVAFFTHPRAHHGIFGKMIAASS